MGSAPAFLVSVIIPLAAKKVYIYDHHSTSSVAADSAASVSSDADETTQADKETQDQARRRVNWSVEGWFDWSLIVFGVIGAGLGVWGTFA